MRRQTRRFGLADMLILIAALGAGMYGARELWQMQVEKPGTHTDEQVRDHADRLLREIDPHWIRSSEAKSTVPRLIEIHRSRSSSDAARLIAGIHLYAIEPNWQEYPRWRKGRMPELFPKDSLENYSQATPQQMRELNAIVDRYRVGPVDRPRRAIPELLMATTHQDGAVRVYARKLLVEIDPGWERSPEARQCYGRLRDIVKACPPNDVSRIEAQKRLDVMDKIWGDKGGFSGANYKL